MQNVCLTSRRNLRTTTDHVRDEQSRVPRLLNYLTSETKEERRHTADSNPIVVRPLEINQFRGRCVNSVQWEVSALFVTRGKLQIITGIATGILMDVHICSNLSVAWILQKLHIKHERVKSIKITILNGRTLAKYKLITYLNKQTNSKATISFSFSYYIDWNLIILSMLRCTW